MSIGSIQLTQCATLVDEWIRAGVTHAIVCPGSRSTPMTQAVASRDDLTVHVRLDERSAAFVALGLARALERPVLVVVTSGTAAAELHAAVVEADLSGVSLIVVTCDRPPELHGVGAAQTIDQEGIFAGSVRASFSPGVPSLEAMGTWRPLGARVVSASVSGPKGPGPVHLNLAFREPLVDTALTLPEGRRGGMPWHVERHGAAEIVGVEAVGGKGIVIAGAGAPLALIDAARGLGWPILADPRSGLRVGHEHVITTADAFLRHDPTAHALLPDTVVIVGEPWASKVIARFVEHASANGAAVVVATDRPVAYDPAGVASVIWRAPHGALSALCAALLSGQVAEQSWIASWTHAEMSTRRVIDDSIGTDTLSEPGVAHIVGRRSAGIDLVVSASMPVRDLEWFGPFDAGRAPGRVFSNRGANGIDGVVSTAIGTALCGRPTVLLIGDLAFLHDVSALVDGLGGTEGDLTVVVVNNGGGAIFSFLPQRSTLDAATFSTYFSTPPRVEPARVAAGFGARTATVRTVGELGRALDAAIGTFGLDVIVVEVPSVQENLEIHDALIDRVSAALDAPG